MFTDNPAKDISSKHENNKTTYSINKKGNYVVKGWENPAGKLDRPTTMSDAKITSGWDPERVHPLTGKVVPHYAYDINSNTVNPDGKNKILNSDLKTMGAGRVTKVHDVSGGGKTIEIDYGKSRVSTYMHNNTTYPTAGDWVNSRQVVSQSGTTGGITGPHLHLEMRNSSGKNQPVDQTSLGNSPIVPNTVLKDKYK